MTVNQLLTQSQPFLTYIGKWHETLEPVSLNEIVRDTADQTAIISVDVVNGFCYEGPLASPRIRAIVEPIAKLFQKSYRAGIRHFILSQDAHPKQAPEFDHFPVHCLQGAPESETVNRFKRLPFFDQFHIVPKNSLNAFIGTDLEKWLQAHPEVNTFITVGDCTDLCTYQLAMGLKLWANAYNKRIRVLLPADCVETYDLPLSAAQEIGALPHDGDFFQHVFLYHMMLNGIEVVEKIVD